MDRPLERQLTEAEKKSAKALIGKIASKNFSDGSSTKRGWVYHKIPFDGFEEILVHKSACVRERALIVDDLKDFDYETMLDVGCSVGWFAFHFARLGKYVLGIEADPSVFDVAYFLGDKAGLRGHVNFFNVSFDDEERPMSYDVVLFLNIHMWLEKKIGIHRAAQSLRNLNLKRIYFQTAHNGSSGMARVERMKTREDIVGYLDACNFPKVELLGETTEHGGIRYLFRAER